MNYRLLIVALLLSSLCEGQVSQKLQNTISRQEKEIEAQLIEWRRQFHQYPELSNQEFKTGAKIAEYLKSLGMEVHYPVAKTGVVGILRGAKPGPVIGLRADMDALPIAEKNSLPFASHVIAPYGSGETAVMHACGHDAHMAMLMGAAKILTQNKSELKGIIKFFFQPAEEGLPPGEAGGASLMIKEGVLMNPKVDVVFGLHIQPWLPVGTLGYHSGGFMAAVDGLNIKVTGKGAHGARPWESIDPIVVSSQIVLGLQTIVSRQTDITQGPAVITIGNFHSGIRRNIIPEEALLEGTIRTFDTITQKQTNLKIEVTAKKIAESAGAVAEVSINTMYPVTYNDPDLARRMLSSLERSAGKEHVLEINPVTIAEDFSFFQQRVPGLFVFLGAEPEGGGKLHPQHTEDFMIDESAMPLGVTALVNLTLDYMFLPTK
jgi:amidohydrolase